jgi:hypothetical protein
MGPVMRDPGLVAAYLAALARGAQLPKRCTVV